MDDAIHAAVEVHVGNLRPGYPAYDNAVDDLFADVSAQPGVSLNYRDRDAPGAKGGAAELLAEISPIAAAAGTSAIAAFKLWLGRDQDRSMTVTFYDGDSVSDRIVVDGQNTSMDALAKAIESAAASRDNKKK